MMNLSGAPSGTGSREPSPDGLGPSGFDPSRVTIAICGSGEPCDHDFAGWRDFDDGCGGELVCTRCGLGAMAHSLSLEDWT